MFCVFIDTATTEIYTLSLHDALPICRYQPRPGRWRGPSRSCLLTPMRASPAVTSRSEEHTSELQSRPHLVCRLLLEKKKREGFPPHRRTNRLPDYPCAHSSTVRPCSL